VERRIAFLPDRHDKSIAYATLGHGRPLVCDVGLVSHLEEQWALPAYRRFFEVLAESHRVILYDPPGIGLGDPTGETVSLEDDVAVLEDLVDRLSLGNLDLFGASQAVPVMVAYAARHPERVGKLILFGGYAHGQALNREDFREAFLELLRTHWGLGSKLASDIWMPGADNELREWFATWIRASASAETGVRRFRETYATDVRDLLPRVPVPVLVLHRRGDKAVRFDLGREVAAGIPGATFAPLEGDVHFFFLGDADQVLERVLEFLGDKRTPPKQPAALSPREQEVAALIHQGLSNGEIGFRLGISERTAESHAEHIRNKLGLRSRAQIAAWAADRLRTNGVR
jgi:pimeloyl-ACP methyl ester carboxylesterase